MQSLPPLDEGACQVWWTPVIAGAEADATATATLDANERARLARLRRAEDRDRYVTAHLLLRRIAAAHLGAQQEPAGVGLTQHCPRCGECDHGQPRIAGTTRLFVSLTHAGDWTGMAITRAGSVGLDVELIDALIPLASGDARQALSAVERQWWQGVSAAERTHILATVWTRKEALLKAAGVGFQTEPQSLTLTPPGEPARLLEWVGQSPTPDAALLDVSPAGEYAGSVAVFTDGPLTVSVNTL